MFFIQDESGQGAAEYILLFGGVIAFAIIALIIYQQYFNNNAGLNSGEDIDKVRDNVSTNHS